MKAIPALIFSTMTCSVQASLEDAVLKPGDSVTITNKTGALTVAADKELKRIFIWNGEMRDVVMLSRDEPWLGSKSIYFPGSGEHWRPNDGITRGVIEEGKRKFKNKDEYRKWMRHEYQAYLDFKYLGKGRIGGWALVKERQQMNCVIWEIRINDVLLDGLDME